MSVVFDTVILVVCVMTVILGIKRGFIKSVMGICTVIAALFVAYAFTPVVSGYIKNTTVIRNISESITDTIKSISRNESGNYDLESMLDEMAEPFQQIVERYNVDVDDLRDHVTSVNNADSSVVESFGEVIAAPVSSAISGVLAFLGLFLATVIALMLLTWILDLIFQLPVLKTANTFFGLIFGILAAILLAWVLSAMSVTLVRAMASVAPEYFSESVIENSVVLRFFSNNQFQTIVAYLTR